MYLCICMMSLSLCEYVCVYCLCFSVYFLCISIAVCIVCVYMSVYLCDGDDVTSIHNRDRQPASSAAGLLGQLTHQHYI